MLKRFAPILFALTLGVVAVVIMQNYLKGQRTALLGQVEAERKKLLKEYEAVEPTDVIVALKDLPAETTIIAEHLGSRSVPKKFVQPFATPRGRDLLGLVTITPIAEGEQMLTNKLRRPSDVPSATTLSGVTPQGKRAVTLGADLLTGVGGFVRPGDHVDVLWTLPVPRGSSSGGRAGAEPVTVTLFQHVPVLAIGNQMLGKTPPSAEGQPQEASRDYTVTVALTPQETALLLYAREQGGVQFSLRPKADKDIQVAVAPATMAMMLESVFGPQMAGEAPKPQRNIEVFKGLERSVVSVDE